MTTWFQELEIYENNKPKPNKNSPTIVVSTELEQLLKLYESFLNYKEFPNMLKMLPKGKGNCLLTA